MGDTIKMLQALRSDFEVVDASDGQWGVRQRDEDDINRARLDAADLIDALTAENAYLRERHAEAVAQLPVTIEVLETFPLPQHSQGWYDNVAKPHLEHLKALAKEAEV